MIQATDFDGGFFRWQITDFEDKGKYWDVPIEDVAQYQFAKNSKVLGDEGVDKLVQLARRYAQALIITPTSHQQESFQIEVKKVSDIARNWLLNKSTFFSTHQLFDFQNARGSHHLSVDLLQFLDELGLSELERKTAETYVLNPQSGEWMKGIQIAAAEAGMKEFKGTVVRTKDLFTGIGAKENRIKYIQSRIGFVVAMFDLMGRKEVVLYRGMATEGVWSSGKQKFFSSWTFSKKVADAFARLEPNDHSSNSYLIKRTIPTNKLFMTYIETKEMNAQYEEVEAIVVHDHNDEQLW